MLKENLSYDTVRIANVGRRFVLARIAACLGALVAFLITGQTKDAEGRDQESERFIAHPSGAFRIRVPADWVAETLASRPDVWQVRGGDLLLRCFFHYGDAGFDSLHVSCMQEFLLGSMQVSPHITYEHDFQESQLRGRRVLDSAFVVRYDRAVLGHSEWRQRNVTIVGAGQSLCIVIHCPLAVWKRSKKVRKQLNQILNSLEFGSGS